MTANKTNKRKTNKMQKTMRIGTVKVSGNGVRSDLFIKAEIEDGKLSISGVIGPKSNGDARGGCGQICMEFAHRNPQDNDGRTTKPIKPEEIEFAAGWTADRWLDLLDIWEAWHLNDMQAGCVHQRAEGWSRRPIDPSKPTSAYGKFFEGQKSDSWNMLSWIRPDEHPEGLLNKPCPVCGYKYGSAWLKQELPNEVEKFLQSLPDTDKEPAWV